MKKQALAALTFVVGIIIVPVAALGYLRFGHPPVAVTDPAFPMEATIVHTPLARRIDREMPAGPTHAASTADFVSGAAIYTKKCAFCHGLPQHASAIGKHMYPAVPQLWQPHRNGTVVGVSDDPVGETYWKVKNGIRLTGMPAYAAILSEDQMWQVSALLAAADKPLSSEAQNALNPQ
jgi:thiosulfate dehydrogenase